MFIKKQNLADWLVEINFVYLLIYIFLHNHFVFDHFISVTYNFPLLTHVSVFGLEQRFTYIISNTRYRFHRVSNCSNTCIFFQWLYSEVTLGINFVFDKFTDWWTSLGLVNVCGVRRTKSSANIIEYHQRDDDFVLRRDCCFRVRYSYYIYFWTNADSDGSLNHTLKQCCLSSKLSTKAHFKEKYLSDFIMNITIEDYRL